MTTELNTSLLYETLGYIKTHPEDWNQGSWRCQTGMCFAGWAATIAGGRWLTDANDTENSDEVYMKAEAEDPLPFVYKHIDPSGQLVDKIMVADRATRILGLTDEESDELFDPINNLEDIERVIGKIVSKHPNSKDLTSTPS